MAEYIKRTSVHSIIEQTGTLTFTRSKMHKQVDSLPAADVVPVVHGRWTESKEHFYLNNGCKEWINFYCSECDAPNNSPTDYCPNCGAKMDLEEQT